MLSSYKLNIDLNLIHEYIFHSSISTTSSTFDFNFKMGDQEYAVVLVF